MKSLLNISDLNQNDFDSILHFADDLDNQTEKILTNKNIGLIFEKNSTRTRLSFQVGINQLDGKKIEKFGLPANFFNFFPEYFDCGTNDNQTRSCGTKDKIYIIVWGQ